MLITVFSSLSLYITAIKLVNGALSLQTTCKTGTLKGLIYEDVWIYPPATMCSY
jgi:hypothetical protein